VSFLPFWLWSAITVFCLSPGLIVVFRYLLPLEFERFKSNTGTIAFDLARYRNKSEEFDSFLMTLRDAMEKAHKTEPNQALVPTPTSVMPAADAPVAPDAGAAHLTLAKK
jgi:hypothetical protein